MNNPVKVGFVGGGFMGQLAHLTNYVASDRCEVVALAELRPQLAQLVADKHHIPKVYADSSQLAQDDDVEAVVAILPFGLNDRVTCELLAAGKHVFIEKPMAASVEAARRMVKAAQEGQALLMVGFMKCYDPGVVQAKQIIDEVGRTGQLGEITFVRAHCFGGEWTGGLSGQITTDESYPQVAMTPPPAWLDNSLHGAFGRFINVYSHNTNLLRFLLDVPLEVSDVNLAHNCWLISFDTGQYAISLEAGALSAHAWDEHTRIYFEHGWIDIATPMPLLRNVPAQVTVYEANGNKQITQPLADWKWAFREEAEHFLECIQAGHQPRTSGVDSLRDMEIAEEVFRRWQEVCGLS